MSEPLNVIALISGGKDSLYSILHCIQNGHKVVALANLYPKQPIKEQDQNTVTTPHKEHEEGQDLDSFMYQTVGYSVVPLYAEALQLPLYRREITGSAIQTARDYAYNKLSTSNQTPSTLQSMTSDQDETEDLVPLLQSVLTNHPEANAVSTGAIQSTYQRTRIESIALRLGLTPLAYLWQYPVLPPPISPLTAEPEREDSLTGLLDDMQAVGCESRIIKIASGGIKEALLWSDVSDPQTRSQLVRGLRRFFGDDDLGLRGAVLGEGGEFETLALCGPLDVWRGGRIEVDEDHLRTYSGEGGASYVRIGAARVVPHKIKVDGDEVASREASGLVRQPAPFDQQFLFVQKALEAATLVMVSSDPLPHPNQSSARTGSLSKQFWHRPKLRYLVSPTSIQIANISYLDVPTRMHSSIDGLIADLPSMTSVQSQISAIVTLAIPKILSQISDAHSISPPLDTSSVVATMLLLSSMSDFAVINPIYSRLFKSGVPNPPSRVTLASPLPEGVKIMISLTLDRGSREHRRGLHVQGRSYWAPANIGPYSQAIAVPLCLPDQSKPPQGGDEESDSSDDGFMEEGNTYLFEIVYVAGQIPLVPSSMDLHQGSIEEQTLISLQHLWRVGQERGVDFWTTGVAFVPQRADRPPNEISDFTNMDEERSIDRKVLAAAAAWREVHLVFARTRVEAATLLRQHQHSKTAEEEEEAVDVWDMQYNHAYRSAQDEYDPWPSSTLQEPKLQHHIHAIPSPNLNIRAVSMARIKNQDAETVGRLSETPANEQEVVFIPSFIAAEVTALPRHASIEWWSTGIASINESSSHGGELQWMEGEIGRDPWQSVTLSGTTPQQRQKLGHKFTNGSATSYVTSLISRTESETCDGKTLNKILDQLLDHEMYKSRRNTISGTILITTDSDPVRWKDLTNISSVTSFSVQEGNPAESNTTNFGGSSSLLSRSLAVIPCHNLWGIVGSRVVVSSNEVVNDISSPLNHAPPKRLEAALLLRIDSIASMK